MIDEIITLNSKLFRITSCWWCRGVTSKGVEFMRKHVMIEAI